MKNARRIIAILLTLILCAAVVACNGDSDSNTTDTGVNTGTDTGSNNQPAPPAPPAPPSDVGDAGGDISMVDPTGLILWPGDVLTVPAGATLADKITISAELPVNRIDPQSSASTVTVCRMIFQMVYERLTYFDPVACTTNPELATRWETSDQKVWTFYLREDVYFHNGDKFTAQDVVNTWQSATEPGSLAYDQWLYVDSMRIINDYTVEITLQKPYSSFAYNLAMPGGAIISKAARDADPVSGLWVGTGVFYVKDFVSGNSVLLGRNENYWGTKALTSEVEYIYVPEMAARAFMQINGETDICMSVPSQDNDMFMNSPDHYLYAYAANSTHSLTFNLNNPITADINFRLAVAHAINREDAAMAASGIWAKPTQDGAFWGDSTPFRNTSIPRIPQDLDLARDYLSKSSYNGELITIITAPDTLTVSSQALQEQLRVIGINCDVYTTDVPTLVSLAGYGNTEFTLLHFVSPFELDPSSAQVMLYPGMSANRATYINQEVNDLLDYVVTVGDPAEQQRVYYEIQEIVARDIPQLSIFEKIWTFITNNRVGGVLINPDMNHDLRGVFMLVDN